MSKKACFLWCLALGLLDGIYCVVCSQIPHVRNYMWIGFISLPIYFCGGAKLAEMPRYLCCSACGALWGAATLVALGLGLFADANMNLMICVTVVVAVCCFFHLGIGTEDKLGGLFCHCPMVFGGFAAIFSQGLGELLWVVITLWLGIVLGWIMGAVAGPISRMVDQPAN